MLLLFSNLHPHDTILYYYCLFHGGMANDAKILIDGFVEQVPEVVATTITVQNSGASDYIFTAEGLQGNDPTLTLVRVKHMNLMLVQEVILFG